jgi:L-threonylcarbamoyladenylate synthase
VNGPVAITEATLRRAAEIVRGGGVVAFPTETYYGLAVDPFQSPALERLFRVKRRPVGLPILVLVSGPEQLGLLARSIPPLFTTLMRCFWPGPLTLVCPARTDLSARLTGNTGTVGVRQSPLVATNQLIAACGGPLTATSANLSGQPAAVTATEAYAVFGDTVELVLDGGATPGGRGSTLVGFSAGRLSCLRDGVIPFAAVSAYAAACADLPPRSSRKCHG